MAQRFRDIVTLEQAREYYEGLGERWPERGQVIAHLLEQLGEIAGDEDAACVVFELCAGGGQLAYPLLQRFESMEYTGFDLLEHGIAYARQKLAAFGPRVKLHQADLNSDGWMEDAPAPADGWISLQSLHDLGDASAVGRMYAISLKLLRPGGRAIFADFLRKSSPDPAADPGRLDVEEHLALLAAAGYVQARCTMETQNFGCFVAEAP